MAGSKFGRLFGRRGSKDEHSSGSEPVEEIQVQEAEDQPEEAQTNSLGTDSDASPPPAAQIGPEAPGALHAEKPPHPACNGGPSPPPFSSLSSHPVTPDRDHSPHHAQKPSGGSSSSGGGSGRGGAAGNGEFQAHLKKVTASLVDLLDQMSTNSASTSPAGSTRDGMAPARRSAANLGVVDLEAPGSSPDGLQNDELVPAQHVRRLTTTVVDILRTIANPRHAAAVAPASGDLDHNHESATLLGDTGSELSIDDKISMSSAGKDSGKDSEISAATALLKAQYLPQAEYRGDDVRPFYMDKRGSTSRLGVEDEFTTIGGSSDVGTEPGDDYPIPRKLIKRKKVNWMGLIVFIFFCCAFVGYVGIRAAKTLGLGGSLWYGIIVLAVEVLGGVAMLPYGLCLTMRVANPPPPAVEAACKGQAAITAVGYHVRVVIPCYKEPLEVIQKTFMAALYAALPANCRRTVYLCDDGKDPEKRRFVRSLGMSNAVYVSGRKRARGEMNGKSANINNAARQIYPEGVPIPLDEVLCVFDADQVPNADFFTKTVPLLDGGQDVAMVLSPQTFYNLNADGDIFNHANVHFWDYTQPGYDALGLISCTGTNFLLRARAFKDAGLFPEWTLTEDFALGIELKRRGWQCCYVDEYLAVGEAPEEVRNCFQQRSRWAKGHFQVFFGRGHNPAFGAGAKGLSLLMRWMYGSVVLSYFSAFLGTPLLMLVPIITVWFGAFPIVINFWAAVSITIYYTATMALMYYTRSLSHLKSMWFASVSNSVLWFAFLKALYRATIGRWLSGTIVFKVTAKGLQRLNNLPLRDVWMSTIWFIFSLVTLIFGLVHFFKGGVLDTPLAISLIFMIYNLIPQYLLLQYASFRPRMFFNAMCKLAMLLSTALVILGVVLVWVLYPKSYNYKSALGASLYFMDTQRIGQLPDNFRVPWRKSSFLSEATTPVYLATNPNETFLTDSFGNFGGGGGYGTSPGFYGASPGGFGVSPGGTSGFGDPFGGSPSPFGSSAFSDPFGRRRLLQAPADPLATVTATPAASDPFALTPGTPPATAAPGSDPFAVPTLPTPKAPVPPTAKAPTPPSKTTPGTLPPITTAPPTPPTLPKVTTPPVVATPSPKQSSASLGADPFSGGTGGLDPFAGSDPFSQTGSGGSGSGGSADPFDPFSGSGSLGLGGNGSQDAQLAEDSWDLSGGWISGMAAGNLKATTPVAFTTAMLAWGYMAFPQAYKTSGQEDTLRDSVRWGADYLLKVHRADPEKNTSLLVSRVGDIDTELLLWYRPEDGKARSAYAVDLNAQVGGYGADLGGSVAAGLAAASTLFAGDPSQANYSASLLASAQEVYDASKNAQFKYTDADYNMTLLYNSSTVYDDLAWAAGWLFKATKNDTYLSDVYDFYVKHLEAEADIADWKFAFDWDNVFWPLNVLLAQETGGSTFKKQSEQFLRSWMCANNAANYTQHGRAFNAMSASLGSTANAAFAALMYSNIVAAESFQAAQTYKCWALSQLRYMMGDSGRSLVVGLAKNPPKRTQDRGAACPAAPAVCNRVTGLLSPDPDTYKLSGALVQGSGLSDDFMDVRSNDAARVGVENNAGFTGAVAGASLLPDGMWEVCLQQFGIYRSNPVCGSFVAV